MIEVRIKRTAGRSGGSNHEIVRFEMEVDVVPIPLA